MRGVEAQNPEVETMSGDNRQGSRQAIILHVDMDAFFAAVELRDHPEYAGKPIVVGAPPNERGVVSTASYEARKYGIHSAMPSSEAYRLCPHAIFLPVDGPRYAAASRQVFAIFDRYTPYVEPLSIDEAFLDVSGATHLFGPPEQIAASIKRDIRAEVGLTCSIGIAPNKFLAKLGSELHKPDGLTLVPFDRASIVRFLRPLPVASIWGVGKVTKAAFDRAGIHLIAQLQDAPLSVIESLVGPHAATHLRALALGEDSRDLVLDWREKSISREYTFPSDIRSKTVLENRLFSLVEEVAAALRADGRLASTARLKIRLVPFETLTRQAPFPMPTRLGEDLHHAAQALLAVAPLHKPVRLIGFGVTGLSDPSAARPLPQQLCLFPEEGSSSGPDSVHRAKAEALERTADAIRARHGANAIHPARQLRP